MRPLNILLCLTLFLFGSAFAAQATAPNTNANPQGILLIIGAPTVQNAQNKTLETQTILNDLISRRTENLALGVNQFLSSDHKNCRVTNIFVAGADADPTALKNLLNPIPSSSTTPLAGALKQALPALVQIPLNAVLMIATFDPICSPNLCQLAQNSTNIIDAEFKVYTLAYGLTPTQTQGFQCMAKIFNGQFIAIQNHHDLTTQLSTILDPIQANSGYGSVNLKAMSKQTGNPLTQNVRWWITRPSSLPGTEPTILQYSNQATPHFQLEPGNYVITVTYAGSATYQPITIVAGHAQNLTLTLSD